MTWASEKQALLFDDRSRLPKYKASPGLNPLLLAVGVAVLDAPIARFILIFSVTLGHRQHHQALTSFLAEESLALSRNDISVVGKFPRGCDLENRRHLY